jgi:hypothetical protein
MGYGGEPKQPLKFKTNKVSLFTSAFSPSNEQEIPSIFADFCFMAPTTGHS